MKKLQYNSPVVLTFFFLSLAELIISALTGGWTKTLLFAVYRAPLSDPLTYLYVIPLLSERLTRSADVLGHAYAYFIRYRHRHGL